MTKTFQQIHMTGEGFRTLGVYRLFFKAALATVRARHAAYEAEVKDWYENGDGRPSEYVTEVECANCGEYLGTTDEPVEVEVWRKPCPDSDEGHEPGFRRVNIGGRGYTFPTCIHGVSRWVDYDCACGWCEDSSTVMDEARVLGREQYLRFNDRWDWVSSAPGDLAYDTRRELLDWATSLFPKPTTNTAQEAA